MSMPGFTAEVSLYKTCRVYQTTNSFSEASDLSQASGIALAALTRGPASGGYHYCWQICQGDPDCIYCCICLAHGGHPNECCF
jgi:hypothetical protein